MVLLPVLADRGQAECCTVSFFFFFSYGCHLSKIHPDFCWLTLLKLDENMWNIVGILICVTLSWSLLDGEVLTWETRGNLEKEKVSDTIYCLALKVLIYKHQLSEVTPEVCDRLHSQQGQKCTVLCYILMSAVESAHTPRLVDWIENMAAAERAANLRKWGMCNSWATNVI